MWRFQAILILHLLAGAAVLLRAGTVVGQGKPGEKGRPKAFTKDESGATVITYKVLSKTKLPEGKQAVFVPELKKLNGQKVTISGFVQPFEDADDMWSFMLIQYPVGCWYCEAPGPTTIVLVEMPEDKELDNSLTSDAVTVTGTLELNEEDPEDFLYIIVDAVAIRAKVRPYVPPPPERPKPKRTGPHP